MPDREKVIKGLECCVSGNTAICERLGCPYADEHEGIGDTCIDTLMADALALLKAQEAVKGEMSDADFMSHIIIEICDFAVKNGMEPNDTLRTIADNIKALLNISTFNNWKPNGR